MGRHVVFDVVGTLAGYDKFFEVTLKVVEGDCTLEYAHEM